MPRPKKQKWYQQFRRERVAPLVNALAWAALFVLPFLPRRLNLALARRLGALAYRLLPDERRCAAANVRIAFGKRLSTAEVDEIVRASFINMILVLLDLFWFSRFRRRRFRKYVEIDPSLHAYMPRGGVIAVSAHFGNWEVLGHALALEGHPCMSAAAPVNTFLNEKITQRLRGGTELKAVERIGGIRSLLAEIRAGRGAGLMMDLTTPPKQGGIFVDFFGLPAATSPAAAILARRTGAPIVPCFCIPQARGRYKVYALPPVPVSKESASDSQAIIRAINERFEQEITKHPTLWLWVEHRWRLIPYGVSFRGFPQYAKKVFLDRQDLRAA